tara:strand:+ start:7915 stop:9090 length:1176 start_codon:yes stop_codon:yes gene_type:complete
MPQEKIVLFYKNLISVGGAELLLCKHYQYLRGLGREVIIICFQNKSLDRVDINQEDVLELKQKNPFLRIVFLAYYLFKLRPSYAFCHSGYIDFGIASIISRTKFSTFIHQPTTMSFNEMDKLSIFFFKRYKNFVKKDFMFKKINSIRKEMSPRKKIFINVRTIISQIILKSSERLFVLSKYAKNEKKDIFKLNSTYLSGAIESNNLLNLDQPLNPPSDGIYQFVTVSRLDENKRIDVILHALKILDEEGYKFKFTVCGDGPARRSLEDLAKKLNITQNVNFLGYVPESEIKKIYHQMDLFITIDWADFRITTYEVLLHNKKLVVSSDTDVDDWLLKSGYLYASCPDSKNLSKIIKESLSSKIYCSNEDLKEYLSNFTWDNYFRSIDKVIRS